MWDQVGQALSNSMTRMLTHAASLLPGTAVIAEVISSNSRQSFPLLIR